LAAFAVNGFGQNLTAEIIEVHVNIFGVFLSGVAKYPFGGQSKAVRTGAFRVIPPIFADLPRALCV
jgi:L-ribulose-5-phosphate 3-epimerase UlaE